jgi:hypothetical protein
MRLELQVSTYNRLTRRYEQVVAAVTLPESDILATIRVVDECGTPIVMAQFPTFLPDRTGETGGT